MALATLRRVRIGVLITLVAAALLVWWFTETAWWSASVRFGGLHESTVDLAGFGGTTLTWCAALACLAYTVAAIPVQRRAHRTALCTGLVASVAAAALWVVLLGRVLRRDAWAHRGWAAPIWARHIAGEDPLPAETAADGLSMALIVVVLLLVIGGVLAVPRRHERTVLLIATMVTIVAALTTSAVPRWVTTGPATAERDWIGVLELPDLRLAVVTLAVLVPIIGAGLLRPRRIVWSVIACIASYAAYFIVIVDSSSGLPLYPDEATDTSALPTDWGAGVTGLFILVVFLPMVAVTRVVCADAAAARRARPPTTGLEPGPVPDDIVVPDLVPDDPPPLR
ncbi:MAG: hypothetical protein ABW000_04735 [Actinoplanes sp.]